MKSKIQFPLYAKIALPAAGAFLLAEAAILLLAKNNIHFYIAGISTPELMLICLFLFGAAFISGLFVVACRSVKHKRVPIFAGVLVTAIFLFVLFSISLFFCTDSSYFAFTSNDGCHHIVIREETYFPFSGGGTVYEKTSVCTMTAIGSYSTPDADRPFTDNNYRILWNETGLELQYLFQNPYLLDEGETGYQSVTIVYPQR